MGQILAGDLEWKGSVAATVNKNATRLHASFDGQHWHTRPRMHTCACAKLFRRRAKLRAVLREQTRFFRCCVW